MFTHPPRMDRATRAIISGAVSAGAVPRPCGDPSQQIQPAPPFTSPSALPRRTA